MKTLRDEMRENAEILRRTRILEDAQKNRIAKAIVPVSPPDTSIRAEMVITANKLAAKAKKAAQEEAEIKSFRENYKGNESERITVQSVIKDPSIKPQSKKKKAT